MSLTLAFVASVLAIIGNFPYILDVLKGKVKPHPYTWLVGSIVSCIVFFGLLHAGGGIGAIPVFVAEVFTIIIFILSLKYGFKNITTTDRIALAVALIAIIPWVITKDPTISVMIAVGIDLVSFIPTLRKTWSEPSTEHWLLYGMNVARHVLILCILATYNIATTLHSVAMIVLNVVMVGIIVLIPLLRKRHSKEV